MSSYFHLEREGVMLSNNKGFMLVEVLISFSLLMTIIITIIPLTVLIEKERKVLNERRYHASLLHDELQQYIGSTSATSKSINGMTITFTKEGNLIRGCILWENVKKNTDEICLYGIFQS